MDILGDEYYMNLALKQAEKAFEDKEIPVGAVITCNGKLVAKAYNQVQRLEDATAHAEMIALTSAQNHLNSKYLNECTLYVTLEPCTMCAGATFWTQIGRIVIGASDPNRGFSRLQPNVLHPKTETLFGILSNECEQMIKDFFKKQRGNNF